eukprot:gene9155-10742_t
MEVLTYNLYPNNQPMFVDVSFSSSAFIGGKTSSSPSPSPINHSSPSSSPKSMVSVNTPTTPSWTKACMNSKCMLCTRGTPRCLCMNHPSWTLILRVVFYSLAQLHPDKEFFNLKKEVYLYLNDHWEILSPTQRQSNNWKRQVQDALSHSRFFRSGRHTLRCNGYWQLKTLCNPWNYQSSRQFETLRFEDIAPPTSSSSPSSTPSSPATASMSPIPEIPWRIAKKPLSFGGASTTTTCDAVDQQKKPQAMNIKQLLSCTNEESDDSYDVSSPTLSSDNYVFGNYSSSSATSGPMRPYDLSSSQYGRASYSSPPSSPSKSHTVEFDEELIVSKIHQMKSILNCTV